MDHPPSVQGKTSYHGLVTFPYKASTDSGSYPSSRLVPSDDPVSRMAPIPPTPTFDTWLVENLPALFGPLVTHQCDFRSLLVASLKQSFQEASTENFVRTYISIVMNWVSLSTGFFSKLRHHSQNERGLPDFTPFRPSPSPFSPHAAKTQIPVSQQADDSMSESSSADADYLAGQ